MDTNVQHWATGLMIGGFYSRKRVVISVFTTSSRLALGPT